MSATRVALPSIHFPLKFVLELKISVKSSVNRALNWGSHAVDLHENPCAIFSLFFVGLFS